MRTWAPEHPERIPALAFFLGGTSSDHQQKQFLLNATQWHLTNPTSKLKYSREKKAQDKLLPHGGKARSQDTNPTMLSKLTCIFPAWVLPGIHHTFSCQPPCPFPGFPLPRRPLPHLIFTRTPIHLSEPCLIVTSSRKPSQGDPAPPRHLITPPEVFLCLELPVFVCAMPYCTWP